MACAGHKEGPARSLTPCGCSAAATAATRHRPRLCRRPLRSPSALPLTRAFGVLEVGTCGQLPALPVAQDREARYLARRPHLEAEGHFLRAVRHD